LLAAEPLTSPDRHVSAPLVVRGGAVHRRSPRRPSGWAAGRTLNVMRSAGPEQTPGRSLRARRTPCTEDCC